MLESLEFGHFFDLFLEKFNDLQNAVKLVLVTDHFLKSFGSKIKSYSLIKERALTEIWDVFPSSCDVAVP